jgi:ClpX C4-type zinc finger protein
VAYDRLRLLAGIMRANMQDSTERPRLCCSFCGKDDGEVRFLAAGKSGMICNACCAAAALIFLRAYICFPFGKIRGLLHSN